MSEPRVLIVEDHADLRKLMRLTLNGFGYRLFEAENGEDALSLVTSERPDLVLLDIMLPGSLSGLDVCRAIKIDEESSWIRVVLLSARTQEEDIKTGREAGADQYIKKPFSPATLLEVVQKELAHLASPRDQKRT
ncbi:MAG: response regulator [Acidobacteriota bacterium]|nr:response regulator [Acidobacteriota bacterium]